VTVRRPKARGDLSIVEMDGEAVIYDHKNDTMHHLNAAAALVFRLCDGSGSVNQLASDIAGASGATPKTVYRQVRQLVRFLREADLLEGTLPSVADPQQKAANDLTTDQRTDSGRAGGLVEPTHVHDEHDLREEIHEQQPVNT
jgi:hypothetical protein